jgi:hypothetical protein
MFDLNSRLVAVGILLFVSGATGFIPFGEAAGAAALIAVLAGLSYRLSIHQMLKPGIAGIIAVGESAVVAYILARSGELSSMGVLVLAPCILATFRHGSRAVFTAPLAAAAILGAYAATKSGIPPRPVLLDACAVLAVGLLLEEHRRSAGVEPQPEVVRAEDMSDLELRETFRKLRDAYRALETESRRDRMRVELAETRAGHAADVPQRLASRLATLTGARSVVLYTVATFGAGLVVRGSFGDLSESELESSLDVDPKQSLTDLALKGTQAVRALREDESTVASVPLVYEGRVVGLVSLSHLNSLRLDEARLIAQDAGEDIAAIVVEARDKEDLDRRLREAEVLYDLRTLEEGAESAETIATRFSAEVSEMINADHVGVYRLENGKPELLAKCGIDARLIEDMSFSGGQGVEGWLGTDAPELLLHEVRKDSRCPAGLGMKNRIGSYLLVPLETENGVGGFVSAACNASGGLGREAAESLRLAALELGRALFNARSAGVMSPPEFHTFIGSRAGYLVVLQPFRRQAIESKFGRPAFAHCMRRLTGRLRLRLPRGAAVCRRAQGDFLVFLPGMEEEDARTWANETVAYASMIGLRTPDGAHVVPMALRARVAGLNQQSNEFFQELTA